MDIKTGIKKEIMHLVRTGKIIGVVLALIGFAFLDPLMYKGLMVLGNYVDEVTGQISSGSEITSDAEKVPLPSMGDTFEVVLGDNPNTVVTTMALTDISGTGLLILVLLLMAAAGGEQKKRSIIIPSCAGLSNVNYALPKFILYPILCFVVSFIGTFVAAYFSILLFGGEIYFLGLVISGALIGLYLAFMITLLFTIGICTARPALSAVLTYLSSVFLPIILMGLRADSFNPFSLTSLAYSFIQAKEKPFSEICPDSTNLMVSIVVTLVLMVIFYFVTLFVLNAKKIDNSGEKAVL